MPPAAVTVEVPLHTEPQRGSVLPVIAAARTNAGSVIVADDTLVQPLASVTITLRTPAHKLSAVASVWGGAGSSHR